MRRVLLLLTLTTYPVKTILAADAAAGLLTESEFFGEMPIVYSASRLPQPKQEAPAAVTVIDAEMIEASGVRRIADIFRLVPGFQVSYQKGHQPSVTYHGLADQFPRRMQVFIDGRSVFGPLQGGVIWSDLPLAVEDVERIEVIRGANAATYGSNAFLGVINIITRHASQTEGTFIKTNIGNKNTRDAIIRQNWTNKQDHYRFTGQYRQDDGFDNVSDSEQTTFFNFRADLTLTDKDTLDIQLGANTGTRGEGRADPPNNLVVPARNSEATSHFQHILWRHVVDSGEEYNVNFFHNYRRVDDDYLSGVLPLPAPLPSQVPLSFSAIDERFDLEFQHSFTPNPNLRVAWGASTRLERVSGRAWFGTDDVRNENIHRIYANTEWRLSDKDLLHFGAMIEDADEFGTNFLPRIAYNHQLNSEHSIRVSVSKATRKPTAIEQHGRQEIVVQGVTVLSNIVPAVSPLISEKITTFEIGYLGQLSSQGLNWGVRAFKNEIRDIITEIEVPAMELDMDMTAFSTVNAGSIDVRGLEFELEYNPSQELRLVFSHAIMDSSASRFREDEFNVINDAQDSRQAVPGATSGLLIIHRPTSKWQLNYMLNHVSDLRWFGDGGENRAYTRLDFNVFRHIKAASFKGKVGLTIQNVGGDYEDFTGNSDFPDNIFDTRYYVYTSFNF